MIDLNGDDTETGMCWAGGYSESDKPWDASWDDHKDLEGPTRNSSIMTFRSYDANLTGMHFFNVHDGPQTSNGFDWRVEHMWGQYIRDDAIENDHFHSGTVYDSLFDGTYTGISTRPTSLTAEGDDGTGEVVTIDKVLLRLQAMPYQFKWAEKPGNIDASGAPWPGTGVPYGHGAWFKYYDEDNSNGDRDTKNSHFIIKDSVFAATHKNVGTDKFNFPVPALIDQCENVTIAWLGDDTFVPDQSLTDVMTAFPSCVTVLQGQPARDFWTTKVTDWHTRHPDVGADDKPVTPGDITFPLIF